MSQRHAAGAVDPNINVVVFKPGRAAGAWRARCAGGWVKLFTGPTDQGQRPGWVWTARAGGQTIYAGDVATTPQRAASDALAAIWSRHDRTTLPPRPVFAAEGTRRPVWRGLLAALGVLGVLGVLGAAAAVVVLRPQWLGDWMAERPEQTARASLPLPLAKPTPARPVPEIDVEPAPTEAPSATVQFHGLAPLDQYPISDWELGKTPAGFINRVESASGIVQPGPDGRFPVPGVLTISGWAGLAEVGMNMPSVLISMCGVVVGVAETGQPRYDVAVDINANLDHSGFSATLAHAWLPRCLDPELTAWAVPPFGTIVFPLDTRIPLDFGGAPRSAEVPDVRPLAAWPTPDAQSPPRLRAITVAADSLTFRSCPDPACAPSSTVAGGHHQGLVLENGPDWVLLRLADATGWVRGAEVELDD